MLGPLAVTVDGEPVPIGGMKQRAFVSMLALHREPGGVGRVADRRGLGRPGARSGRAHAAAARLFGPQAAGTRADRRRLDPRTKAPGYALHVDALDIDEFEREAAAGVGWPRRPVIGPTRSRACRAALARWRGARARGRPGTAVLDAAAVRLDEQRLSVAEMQIDARLECGESREVVPGSRADGGGPPVAGASARSADGGALPQRAAGRRTRRVPIGEGDAHRRARDRTRRGSPRSGAGDPGAAAGSRLARRLRLPVPGCGRPIRASIGTDVGPHRSSRRPGRAPLGGHHRDRSRSRGAGPARRQPRASRQHAAHRRPRRPVRTPGSRLDERHHGERHADEASTSSPMAT